MIFQDICDCSFETNDFTNFCRRQVFWQANNFLVHLPVLRYITLVRWLGLTEKSHTFAVLFSACVNIA